MHIDWWTLALQTINVLVLVWLLGHFLYKPVLAAIANRQAAADKLLDDAQAARTAAETQSAELQAQTATLAAQAQQRQATALAAAEVERKALLDKAAQDVAAKQAQAEAALAQERRMAGEAMQREAADLAVAIASRLLDRLPAAIVTEAMFQSLLDKIAALPTPERQQIAQAAGRAAIVTAAPLSNADQSRCLDALEKALGQRLPAHFNVDAALIAGFEFSAAGVLVTNSWRADLAALSRKLAATVNDASHAD
jgi:F-type H+-transporting ATPase subunit b